MIGGLYAVTIAIAEVGILASGQRLGAPPPPPEVLAALESDPCALRMMKIMTAIEIYRARHGSPPPSLAVLHPKYLDFVPIDPAANRPYGYQLSGESVVLTCPSAAAAVAADPNGS